MTKSEIQKAVSAYEQIMNYSATIGVDSYGKMCDHIAKSGIFPLDNGQLPTIEQVFNYSPTGELAEIPFLYCEAVETIGFPDGTAFAFDPEYQISEANKMFVQ